MLVRGNPLAGAELPLPFVGARNTAKTSLSERAVDLALLALLAPVIVVLAALIALAIYIDSPGPVIYRARRIGRGGETFEMLKFRKMRNEASGDPLTLTDDARFTPIGRFLSVTRLDELPQVINILRGEMRLVGPRPEVECFVDQFAAEYAEILKVAPGLTGIAQLRFLDEKALLAGADPVDAYRREVLPRKVQIDLAYAHSRSLVGDLTILARTVALPVLLLSRFLRMRSAVLRAWTPAAAGGALLVLLFALSSGNIA